MGWETKPRFWTDKHVIPPSPLQSLYCVSCQSSVRTFSFIVSWLGLSVVFCRHQKQIIRETPAPYFREFNFPYPETPPDQTSWRKFTKIEEILGFLVEILWVFKIRKWILDDNSKVWKRKSKNIFQFLEILAIFYEEFWGKRLIRMRAHSFENFPRGTFCQCQT